MVEVKMDFLPCQTCWERVHCDVCERRLEDKLMSANEVRSAVVQMARKQIIIDTDLRLEELEEILEEFGVLVK